MPTAHRTTILVAAALGAALLVVAVLATTGLIIWEPSVSVDVLLYNLSGVLLISALACHIGCRIHHRCTGIEVRQARIEQHQQQVLTEIRQTDAILQVIAAQTAGADEIAEALATKLAEVREAGWADGYAAATVGRSNNVAPLPRTPIGRG